MSRTIVGIDPGVGRAGVVIMNRDGGVDAAATFKSTETEFTHGCRVIDLSREMTNWVVENTPRKTTLVLSIESPIAKRGKHFNPHGFALQWRLVQALISGHWWDYVYEIHNKQVKVTAGSASADKDYMVNASPFSYDDYSKADAEALADAWAIAKTAHLNDPRLLKYAVFGRKDACHVGPCVEV